MKLLQEIKIPQESVNDKFVTVVSVLYNENDFVEKGDMLIELETSKAIFTIESEVSGYIKYYCQVNDEVEVNSTIIKIFDEIVIDSLEINQSIQNTEFEVNETIFSKRAEKYIKENNVNKSKFKNYDFVALDDVFNLLGINQSKISSDQIITEINFEKVDEKKVDVQEISKNKKREIEYLKAVQKENLNSNVNVFIDTSNLFVKINPFFKYLKNSLLPLIIFETSKLLMKYPEINSYFVNNQLAIYKKINIGFAIDMQNGLKTVKIEDTNTRTLQEIENKIMELSNKYIDNKLSVDDLSEITFTITDLASEGVYFFVPLINKDNAAILGVSANDEKLNRTILSLTFDHRVIEGKKATMFLNDLKKRIESYKLYTKTQIDTNIRCYKCLKSLKDDYNDVGFLKVVTKEGEEKYICQSCFNGF